MALQVVNGAVLTCNFGTAPSTLIVLPTNSTLAGNMPAANILDSVPVKNIGSFIMCQSPTSPIVIAATVAKAGVFTPVPCLPAVVTPWIAGSSTVNIGNLPALNDSSRCICALGGTISIAFAGQTTVQIP